ncbi:hypothetical protein AVEN_234300-1 [Araneus ventricosus]|uniref:Neurotransmitter-gated ion-channel ligand-binding domain-containing protein n=1 Tax=Araneus ventricosus TaxID=182803 RepID=A0A4Y2A808_ARAVE|nr:hypothetical protein AVEN_234300-1 [Araneus ventricosus]
MTHHISQWTGLSIGLTILTFHCKVPKLSKWMQMVSDSAQKIPEDSAQGPHEKRLLNDLLSSYNVLERPVANESEPLLISFGLTLQQIIDVVSNAPHISAIHC